MKAFVRRAFNQWEPVGFGPMGASSLLPCGQWEPPSSGLRAPQALTAQIRGPEWAGFLCPLPSCCGSSSWGKYFSQSSRFAAFALAALPPNASMRPGSRPPFGLPRGPSFKCQSAPCGPHSECQSAPRGPLFKCSLCPAAPLPNASREPGLPQPMKSGVCSS